MSEAFPKTYFFALVLSPSTLTTDTVYFSMKNTGTSSIILRRCAAQLFFTGTAGSAISPFALQRKSGITPTGGTVITPTKGFSIVAGASVDCRFSDSGLANTGTATTTDRFDIFGQPSQANITIGHPFESEDENPLNIAPGECLLIVANNTIISGVRVLCKFIIYETP